MWNALQASQLCCLPWKGSPLSWPAQPQLGRQACRAAANIRAALANSLARQPARPQDRVLIEVEEAKAQTSGGLLLTEGSKDKPTMGKVVAVGPGREEEGKTVAPKLSVGATVLYQKYSGTEVRLGLEAGAQQRSLECGVVLEAAQPAAAIMGHRVA